MEIDHLHAEIIRQFHAHRLMNQYPTAIDHPLQETGMVMPTALRRTSGLMLRQLHLPIIMETRDPLQVVRPTKDHTPVIQFLKPRQRPQSLCQPTIVPVVPLFFLHLLARVGQRLLLIEAPAIIRTVAHHLIAAAVHPQRLLIMGLHHVSLMTLVHHHRIVSRIMGHQRLMKRHIVHHLLSGPITAAQRLTHALSASIISPLYQL